MACNLERTWLTPCLGLTSVSAFPLFCSYVGTEQRKCRWCTNNPIDYNKWSLSGFHHGIHHFTGQKSDAFWRVWQIPDGTMDADVNRTLGYIHRGQIGCGFSAAKKKKKCTKSAPIADFCMGILFSRCTTDPTRASAPLRYVHMRGPSNLKIYNRIGHAR